VLETQLPDVAEAQPELLAQHYMGAGRGEQAIPYWQRAGQRAVERSAHVEAVSHFTQGLELLKTLPGTTEHVQHDLALHLAIGVPLLMLKGHTAPEVEHAYARASELAQHLGETPQRLSVLVGLWRFYYSRARLHTARELVEQCFVLAQHLCEPASLQEAHTYLGSTLFLMGDLVAAHAHLEQGIALYDPEQSHTLAFSRGNDPGVVCLSRASWVLWWLGYPNKALIRSHEAIALARRSSHPYSLGFALQYSSVLHQWRREMQLVKERSEAVIALMNEHGFVQWLGRGMSILGWVLAEQEAVDEGIRHIRQGLAMSVTAGLELGRQDSLILLAEAYGKARRAEEGLRVLTDVLTAVQQTGELHYEAELYRLKGELLLQQALQSEAEACFQQAIDVARHQCAKSLELRATLSLARL